MQRCSHGLISHPTSVTEHKHLVRVKVQYYILCCEQNARKTLTRTTSATSTASTARPMIKVAFISPLCVRPSLVLLFDCPKVMNLLLWLQRQALLNHWFQTSKPDPILIVCMQLNNIPLWKCCVWYWMRKVSYYLLKHWPAPLGLHMCTLVIINCRQ